MSDNIEVKFGAETSGLNAGAQQAATAVEKALKRMEGAFAKMASETKTGSDSVKHGMESIKNESERTANALQSFGNSLKGIFAVGSIAAIGREFVQLADQISLNDARLKITTKTADEFANAQKAIYQIAQSNNVGIGETTVLYTKLDAPVKRLGGSYKETTAIVDAFATSLRLGGANTQEAAAATLQFAQAMGSGKLQGDEFRSMAEASPRFMKALAEGMNVPIEQLKKMGSEGKLTADVVGNALIKELGQLKEEAASLPDTAGGAFTRLKNDIYQTVRTLNDMFGVTQAVANGFNVLADYVKELEQTFKDTEEASDGTSESFGGLEIASKAVGVVFETILVLGANVKFVLVTIGRTIGAVGAAIAAVANGDFRLIPTIFQELEADSKKAREELDKFEQRVLKMGSNVAKARQAIKDGKAVATGNAGSDAKPILQPPAGTGDDKNKESRIAAWRDELTQKLEAGKQYFKNTAQMELEHWERIKANNKLTVEEQRSINGIIFGLHKQLAQDQRSLEMQAIEAKKAAAMADIQEERANIAQKQEMGVISKQQELEQLRVLKEKEYQLELQSFEEKLALIKEEGLARQKLLDDLEAAKKKHNVTMKQDETQLFLEIKQKWQNAFSPITSAFSTAVTGIIQGTTTLKQAVANMAQSILISYINMGVQMLANWVATQLAIMTFGKLSAEKEGMAQAGAGAAAAMASVAAIPYIGWAMAPEVGEAHFGMASAFVQAGMAAEKGFDVPAGVNPVTQLHQKEMVLPASLADNVRNMTDGGKQQPINVSISAVDGESVRKLFMREGHLIADALKLQTRNFKVAKA